MTVLKTFGMCTVIRLEGKRQRLHIAEQSNKELRTMKSFGELLDTSKIAKQEAYQENILSSQQLGSMGSTGKTNIQNMSKQENQQQMITVPQEFSLPFLNMLNDKDIDWEGNYNFENGRVVSFKHDKFTNHFHMRQIPQGEKATNAAKEVLKTLEVIMQSATMEQVALAFKKLYVTCGKQNRSPEEMKYMFTDYYNDLGKYPIKLIEEACEAYRKLPEGNEFMPTSGKLIALMAEKWHKMLFMKTRINKILGLHVEPTIKQNKILSLDEALARLM